MPLNPTYMPAGASNTLPGARQRMSGYTTGAGPVFFESAGAPAANVFAGSAAVGDLLVDRTGGQLYICTATNGTTTATWTKVGTQV